MPVNCLTETIQSVTFWRAYALCSQPIIMPNSCCYNEPSRLQLKTFLRRNSMASGSYSMQGKRNRLPKNLSLQTTRRIWTCRKMYWGTSTEF